MTNEVNVRPGHGVGGRHPTREGLDKPKSKAVDSLKGHDDPGMFGRMFPGLPALEAKRTALEELGAAMLDADPGSADGNTTIPAGFTYLGQFVDHDITLDLTSFGDKQADPQATDNFRTPALDLDSIYGLGPDGSRQLYARNPPDFSGRLPGPKFLIGTTQPVPQAPGGIGAAFPNDLPRSPEGFALIGDHRNDENLLVAQTHLAMLKFHNKVCDDIRTAGQAADDLFREARRIVTWHYQWMVLHDFVERITEPGIVARILDEGRKYYRFKSVPYMPVEFSVAAYRFGHSMVREQYSHNHIFTFGAPAGAATLDQFFTFTGLSGIVAGQQPGFLQTFPSNWIIDWRRYHEVRGDAVKAGQRPPPGEPPLNATRKIDPFLVKSLHDLPGGGGDLAFRNLQRGVNLGLPSGQAVAEAMKIKNGLTPDEIAKGPDGAVAKKHGLHANTPLWYYILKEAQQRCGGERLGPVGATIVAEVFVGLVHGDHDSYLWQRKDWKPELPSAKAGTFTMADLLRYVGDLDPLGKFAAQAAPGQTPAAVSPAGR